MFVLSWECKAEGGWGIAGKCNTGVYVSENSFCAITARYQQAVVAEWELTVYVGSFL